MKWILGLKNLFLFFLLGIMLFGCGGSGGGDGGGGGDDDNDNPVEVGWIATDGPFGGNINQILAGPDNFIRAMEKIYAVGTGSVFYTSNGGNIWYSRNLGLPDGEVQSISAVDARMFYVGVKDQGIYISTNGGSTWTSANPVNLSYRSNKNSRETLDFFALLALGDSTYFVGVNEQNSAKFYEVTKGEDWIATELPMPTTPNIKKIYSIITRESGGQSHFYVATDVDVFLTLNRGRKWEDKKDWIPGTTPENKSKGLYELLGGRANVYSLKLLSSQKSTLPFNQEILYAGIQDNLSSDGRYKLLWRFNGLSWTNVFYEAASFKDDKIVSIAGAIVEEDSLAKDRIYIALSNNGLYFSEYANAATPVWTEKNKLASDQEVLPSIPGPSVTSLAVGFGQGQRAADLIYRASPIYGVMLENDGKGFEKKDLNLRSSVVNAMSIRAAAKIIIAATNSGLYIKDQTLDFWTRLEDSIKGNDSKYIGIIGTPTHSEVLTITHSRAYQSTDGGLKWIQDGSSSDFDNNKLTCITGNLPAAWVGTDSSKVWYRSEEQIWNQIKSPPAQTIYNLAYATRQDALYAGTNTGIFKHNNPDSTQEAWQTGLNSGIIQNKEVKSLAVNSDGTILLASVLNQDVAEGIYYYNQTRAEWARRATGLSNDAKIIYAIEIYGNEVFIATEDGVWYNEDITDETKEWVSRNYLLNMRILSMVIYPLDKNIIYVGADGTGVYKTDTGGN